MSERAEDVVHGSIQSAAMELHGHAECYAGDLRDQADRISEAAEAIWRVAQREPLAAFVSRPVRELAAEVDELWKGDEQFARRNLTTEGVRKALMSNLKRGAGEYHGSARKWAASCAALAWLEAMLHEGNDCVTEDDL